MKVRAAAGAPAAPGATAATPGSAPAAAARAAARARAKVRAAVAVIGHGPGFGPGFGPGHGRGPWARAKRGDVRAAILLALADEPMHGYQIMQQLEQRSGGAWRPSPGSVYPTLQLLEDQGLIKGEEAEGKRVFSLTEAGVAEAAAVKERLGDSPFGEGGPQDPRFALRQAIMQLGAAVKQVAIAGSADDVQKALEILRTARKSIYALLADAD